MPSVLNADSKEQFYAAALENVGAEKVLLYAQRELAAIEWAKEDKLRTDREEELKIRKKTSPVAWATSFFSKHG